MNDHISGILVLQKYLVPGLYRIWFQYTRADGLIGYSTIPMKEKAAPMPQIPDKFKTPVWDFVRENPFLSCSPSVRILGPKEGSPDHFHNSGLWRNHYVEMAKPFGESEPEADDLCHELNKLATKEERDAVIFKLRADGVLL